MKRSGGTDKEIRHSLHCNVHNFPVRWSKIHRKNYYGLNQSYYLLFSIYIYKYIFHIFALRLNPVTEAQTVQLWITKRFDCSSVFMFVKSKFYWIDFEYVRLIAEVSEEGQRCGIMSEICGKRQQIIRERFLSPPLPTSLDVL